MTITTNDVLFEEFLKIFPGSKVISESPLKAETTDDQWKRGRKEMARNKELVAAIIKANAEQLTLFLSGVQLAGQEKETTEKPKAAGLLAPQITPAQEFALKQPPNASDMNNLTLEQENALEAFLAANPANGEKALFDSEAFLVGLEKNQKDLIK